MMTQAIQSVNRPAPEGDTALPQELRDWLSDRGLRPSWQPYNENHMNQLFGKGFEPLPVDRIKEDNEELYEKVFKGSPGTRRLIEAPDTGYIRNYDTVLMVQPNELWEQMETETRERIESIEARTGESKEELAAALAELLDVPGISNVSAKKARSPWVLLEEMERA
jgi:hypothetical protein